MLAKYAGTCNKCQKAVNVGENISWNRKRRGVVYHTDCATPKGSFASYEAKTASIETVTEETTMTEETSMEQNYTNGFDTKGEYEKFMENSTFVTTPKPANGDLAAMLANAINGYLPKQEASIDAEKVREIVKAEMANVGALPTRVEFKMSPESEVKDLGLQHKQFSTLLTFLSCQGVNIWVTGPAGSGKTTAAHNASEALGLKFYFCGAQSNEYGLLGFIDAQSRLVRTPFRDAYENGGVFLFDEIDASSPAALLAFNAALANGVCAFPDGIVKKHEEFRAIAAANTFGLGGTNDYVGRMKQDAAFIDRFVFLTWEYDEALETATCGNVDWSYRVQAVRANVKRLGIKVIISPRASYYGAKLIAAGVDMSTVETVTLKKGMDSTQWDSVR